MGNCQAAEAATVVIQHPSGKIERLYWPTTAEDVMKSNPGHHVALVTLYVAQQQQQNNNSKEAEGAAHLRFTRVRLLKPKDILLIGQVYRLITSQEVSKALKARKLEKTKKAQQSEVVKKQRQQQQQGVEEEEAQRAEQQQQQQKASARARGERQWRPRLQSISEGVS